MPYYNYKKKIRRERNVLVASSSNMSFGGTFFLSAADPLLGKTLELAPLVWEMGDGHRNASTRVLEDNDDVQDPPIMDTTRRSREKKWLGSSRAFSLFDASHQNDGPSLSLII